MFCAFAFLSFCFLRFFGLRVLDAVGFYLLLGVFRRFWLLFIDFGGFLVIFSDF